MNWCGPWGKNVKDSSLVLVLLHHHGQSLGIGLPAGRQLSGRAEEGDPVALVVRHALVTLMHNELTSTNLTKRILVK